MRWVHHNFVNYFPPNFILRTQTQKFQKSGFVRESSKNLLFRYNNHFHRLHAVLLQLPMLTNIFYQAVYFESNDGFSLKIVLSV